MIGIFELEFELPTSVVVVSITLMFTFTSCPEDTLNRIPKSHQDTRMEYIVDEPLLMNRFIRMTFFGGATTNTTEGSKTKNRFD